MFFSVFPASPRLIGSAVCPVLASATRQAVDGKVQRKVAKDAKESRSLCVLCVSASDQVDVRTLERFSLRSFALFASLR